MESLYYFKFDAKDASYLEQILDDAQYGYLLRMIMKFGQSFTKEQLPPQYADLQKLYEFFTEKALAAKKAYEDKVIVNAANGSKGGKQKAENARQKRAAQNPPPFSLTPEEIKDLYDCFCDKDIVSCTKREFTKFLNRLFKNNWYVGTIQIQTKDELETPVVYGLNNQVYSSDEMAWHIFCAFVEMLTELFPDITTIDDQRISDGFWFIEDSFYHEEVHEYFVDGKTYQESDYRKVFQAVKDKVRENLTPAP